MFRRPGELCSQCFDSGDSKTRDAVRSSRSGSSGGGNLRKTGVDSAALSGLPGVAEGEIKTLDNGHRREEDGDVLKDACCWPDGTAAVTGE